MLIAHLCFRNPTVSGFFRSVLRMPAVNSYLVRRNEQLFERVATSAQWHNFSRDEMIRVQLHARIELVEH